MAEHSFREVMHEVNRLCMAQNNCDNDCPLENIGCCGNFGAHCSNPLQVERIEDTVMAWAAEHPVVYPMWCEWLAEKGVVDVARMPVDYSGGIVTEIKPIGKMYEHIPADIAQKLGIEPAPVVHGDCGATNEADARKKLGIEPKEG